MEKLLLLSTILIGITFYSCSSDDDNPSDNTPSYVGTYNLTSITSNEELDPDVTGNFDDTELIDDIACTSIMILNSDNSFSWDFLGLSQILNTIGTITYNQIECATFTGGTGDYQVNNNGISFVFDSSISNTNALINEDSVTVTIIENLVVNNNGTIQSQDVQLTLTYE